MDSQLSCPRLGRPKAWLCLVVALVATQGCADATSPSTTLQGALGPGTAGRWVTATPESVGLDRSVLLDLEVSIERGDFGETSSLLILRDGKLVYERYADGWSAVDLHPVYSVTKSVASLLVGFALEDGLLPGVEAPLLDLLPEYADVADPDPAKSEITLAHALQMRAGFEWDELSTNYTNGTNPTLALATSPDWTRHVLELPMSDAPGERFAYNSGVSILLSSVLNRAGVSSAEAYAADELFGPLGIDRWQWSTGPGGLSNTGWGLQLRPRDMAALGQLVLDGGRWGDTQLLSPQWIVESAEPATRFTDGTAYGYQWWLGPSGTGANPSTRSLAAWGWGGQFVVVMPTLDLVMVSTAENYGGGGLDPDALAAFAFRAAGVSPN